MMKEFTTFVLVGGVGLLVNMGLTYLGVTYIGLWYLWAFCLSTIVGWTIIFIGNALFTFPKHEQHSYVRKYLAFIAGYAMLFWVNVALVFTFTTLLSVNYLISIVLGSFITTLLTFTFNRKVIFR